MNKNFFRLFSFFVLFFSFFCFTGISAKSKKVEIKNKKSGYVLTVDGKPTFVKGAVGHTGIDLVKKYGGNGIRSGSNQKSLDEAHKLGLMVLANLPVASQRGGFNYDDTAAVRAQHEKVLDIVRNMKDHPAVLMWALGNELDHVPQKVYEPNKIYYNMKVWDAVNDLAKAIHEIDPNHPVMTVVGSITEHKIGALVKQCPDLDLLGINEYGDLLQIPVWLREWGWNKPYMVTEWGPTGFWQMPRTPWNYHVEENSSEKADKYKERYEGTILKDKEMCLGSFVFLWRQHQEYTHTWFGMFDKEWRETEAVDVMRYEWTGRWPANRAPRVDSMKLNQQKAMDFVYLEPGEKAFAQVWMRDAPNDKVVYKWEILPEQTDFGYGGNGEKKPAAVDCAVEGTGEGCIRFSVPLKEGAYRLFVAGYDEGNHAAFSNIPFYVRSR
ncbi:MAG: glycoside hydrolase family 2 TIM barrel-domain containing protein [Bacteroidales bacterium]|nr:glycoside hydrolase family 2 TIM barrel-domain containing protein [Bacteroidales bacterium]